MEKRIKMGHTISVLKAIKKLPQQFLVRFVVVDYKTEDRLESVTTVVDTFDEALAFVHKTKKEMREKYE